MQLWFQHVRIGERNVPSIIEPTVEISGASFEYANAYLSLRSDREEVRARFRQPKLEREMQAKADAKDATDIVFGSDINRSECIGEFLPRKELIRRF